MHNAVTRSQIFVLDQDEALDFYTNTLGLELADDLDLGFMGGWLPITTDDAEAASDTMVERGVDVNDELVEKPYGIDFGIRDPFGNARRIGQLFERKEG